MLNFCSLRTGRMRLPPTECHFRPLLYFACLLIPGKGGTNCHVACRFVAAEPQGWDGVFVKGCS